MKAKNFKDITGVRFGRLIVVEYSGTGKNWQSMWLVKCDCGKTITVPGIRLRWGDTKSCGCLRVEMARKQFTTHGQRGTHEYNVWVRIRQRCYNKKNPNYEDYGGRGVVVCDEWIQSFENFLKDVGNHPHNRPELDRIDNNGNYEPGNVRWADDFMQANNRRSNHNLSFSGKTMTIAQWARETGIKRSTLSRRIHLGWTAEKTLTTPV